MVKRSPLEAIAIAVINLTPLVRTKAGPASHRLQPPKQEDGHREQHGERNLLYSARVRLSEDPHTLLLKKAQLPKTSSVIEEKAVVWPFS